MKRPLLTFALLLLAQGLFNHSQAQHTADVRIDLNGAEHTISRHIYGHFAEHLGRGIYEGIWVGKDSPIPNINGVRADVVQALKALDIPNVRWPGGCFADQYHWMDGIGPVEDRPVRRNDNNQFGTHEFLDFCELIGTEPYICANVGTGTPQEFADWVEYITSDGDTPMANLRRQNGREKPWNVKYWAIGNENWDCGGNMTAEYYAEMYRRFEAASHESDHGTLYKVAGGPSEDDTHWMEAMMRYIPLDRMEGVSVHYYTITENWAEKGSAYEFTEDQYLATVANAQYMDMLVNIHTAIMDRYDPEKKIALVVDEWGNWFDLHPGAARGSLYQQNTLRDAITAGITMNIFNNRADRVRIANIAQMINVLQSVILTDGPAMTLTPTYHAFDMYRVHMDAKMLPVTVRTENMLADGRLRVRRKGPYDAPQNFRGPVLPANQVSASASVNDAGTIHISLVNADPRNAVEVSCTIDGLAAGRKGAGKIITSGDLQDHNTFADPNKVVLYDFDDFSVNGGRVAVKLPAKSVVTLEIRR